MNDKTKSDKKEKDESVYTDCRLRVRYYIPDGIRVRSDELDGVLDYSVSQKDGKGTRSLTLFHVLHGELTYNNVISVSEIPHYSIPPFPPSYPPINPLFPLYQPQRNVNPGFNYEPHSSYAGPSKDFAQSYTPPEKPEL